MPIVLRVAGMRSGMSMSQSSTVAFDGRVSGYLEQVQYGLLGGVVAKGHRNEVFRNDKPRCKKQVFEGDLKWWGVLEEANVESGGPVGRHEVLNAGKSQKSSSGSQ